MPWAWQISQETEHCNLASVLVYDQRRRAKDIEMYTSCNAIFTVVLFSCYLTILNGSHESCFELKESQHNEVIFIGERDIVIICEVTSLPSSDIKIEHNGGLVASNNGIGNYVQYTIHEAILDDGGNYSCTAAYNDQHGNTTTITKHMYLNVHHMMKPQCFRNGTEGMPYKKGEILLISCYCPPHQTCTWSKTVLNSKRANVISPYETNMYKNKTVSRILVGPFTTDDSNTRYDCYFQPTPVSTAVRCSINGIEYLSEDVATINYWQSSSAFEKPVSTTKLQAHPLPNFSVTPFVETKAGISHIVVISAVFGSMFVLVFLMLLGVCITCVCLKKLKKDEEIAKHEKDEDLKDCGMVLNSAYEPFTIYGNPDVFLQKEVSQYGIAVAQDGNDTRDADKLYAEV